MTKYLLYILFVMLAIVILNSCSNSTKYELTIEKELYVGNELRIDGYYYQKNVIEDNEYTEVLFFFRDGVVLYGSTFSTFNFATIEKIFLDGKYEGIMEYRDVWSTFKISKDSLVFETWILPTISQGPEPIINFCKIINDTTFIVYKRKPYSKNEHDEVNETYHFKQFDHKPDSTNNFIK